LASANATIDPVERVTLGQQVYAELRELLMAGELAPGDKLSLRAVAGRLGVSMMPVRQAVSRLVTDDALEVLPNRAVSVPVMTIAKFRELTRVRVAVEGFAAEEGALARSDADLHALAMHEAAFRREAQSHTPDLARAVRANKDLHFAVYAAAGLPALVAIIEGLWLRIGPVLNLDMKVSGERLAQGGAADQHARALAAIAARDGPAARAAIVADITAAAAFIEASGRLPD
jgi:DNA-binding GntR family transcriptional regulator